MVFKGPLGSFGIGGPAADTDLAPGPVLPGGRLVGEVRLKGGGAAFDIERITLDLTARVEAGAGGGQHGGVVVLDRFRVGGGFRLDADEERGLPFSVTLPWETPVTEIHGQLLGIVLGVRTELGVAGAKDKGGIDPLRVGPLPVQEAVLEALGQLGFGLTSADLAYGRIGGTGQRLPFYQEIVITPAPRYAHAMREIEVTFLANAGGVEVVLEADRPRGLFSSGHDALTRFTVGHEGVEGRDWRAEVDGWMRQLAARHGTRSVPAPHGPGDAYSARTDKGERGRASLSSPNRR
ncbi:sporulation protein [Streptomyces erythrochromogenes]|uniref:sporulation protein n=1 Tax=Streptomyces erythrochromogenes TaxID=285574 RepID=UPI0036759A5A